MVIVCYFYQSECNPLIHEERRPKAPLLLYWPAGQGRVAPLRRQGLGANSAPGMATRFGPRNRLRGLFA
jgi:hypothetical protein